MGLLIGESLPDEIVLGHRESWALDQEALADVFLIPNGPNDDDTDLASPYNANDRHWTRQYEPRLGELRRLFAPDDGQDTPYRRLDW